MHSLKKVINFFLYGAMVLSAPLIAWNLFVAYSTREEWAPRPTGDLFGDLIIEPLFRYDNNAARCWHKVDRLRRQAGYGPYEPIMWKSSLFAKYKVAHSFKKGGPETYTFNDDKGNALRGSCRDGYSPNMKDVYFTDPNTGITWPSK